MTLIKSALLPSMLALAMLMIFSRPGHAATITVSDSVVNAQTDIDNILSVAQFNPALGTLTSAQVSLSDDTNITLSLNNATNADITSDTLRLHPVTVNLDFTGPVGLDASGLIDISQTVAQEYKNELIPAMSSWSTPTFDATGSDGGTYTLPGDLANFIGLGTVDYEAVTVSSSTVSYSGATSESSVGYASAYVTVTYTYVPAPEPASIVMLGLGAVGIWWASSRRRKS